MAKRALILGPTGSGKSTLINILFNKDVTKESLLKPAIADDTTTGVTSVFTTYYDFPSYAYTDSIGFGDDRFDQNVIFRCLKSILMQSMVGYNRIYLCLKYGRISREIRDYIEFLITVFDKNILSYCTVVFTNCDKQSMTKDLFLEKNKADNDLCAIIKNVHNIIFVDFRVADDDEEMEGILLKRRKNDLDKIKIDIEKFSENYFVPRPTSVSEWIVRISRILLRMIEAACNPLLLTTATVISITRGEIDILKKLFESQNHVKYNEYYGECSICRDSMWLKDTKILKCHHIFHDACLRQTESPRCPICRTVIDEPTSDNELR